MSKPKVTNPIPSKSQLPFVTLAKGEINAQYERAILECAADIMNINKDPLEVRTVTIKIQMKQIEDGQVIIKGNASSELAAQKVKGSVMFIEEVFENGQMVLKMGESNGQVKGQFAFNENYQIEGDEFNGIIQDANVEEPKIKTFPDGRVFNIESGECLYDPNEEKEEVELGEVNKVIKDFDNVEEEIEGENVFES